MRNTKIKGWLEIDRWRGVIYFHTTDTKAAEHHGSVTILRICKLPAPIPDARALDITHMSGVSWVIDEQRLEEIARGNIERHLSDIVVDRTECASEEAAADIIYDEAYTLGLDALLDAGVPVEKAREIAQRVAQLFAQP